MARLISLNLTKLRFVFFFLKNFLVQHCIFWNSLSCSIQELFDGFISKIKTFWQFTNYLNIFIKTVNVTLNLCTFSFFHDCKWDPWMLYIIYIIFHLRKKIKERNLLAPEHTFEIFSWFLNPMWCKLHFQNLVKAKIYINN